MSATLNKLASTAVVLALCRPWASGSAFAAAQSMATTNFTNDDDANCPLGLTAQDIAARSGLNLEGKVALVTGGRSGLGYSIAEALVARNCSVVIASRHEERNKYAVEDLKDAYPGSDVSYMTFDLEDFSNVRSFAARFIASHNRLDYYFGNAGQSEEAPSGEITVDGFERIFQVNYVSQFLLLQLFLPLLRSTPGSSRIILTASSTHPLACGNIGLTAVNETTGEQYCFDDSLEDNAIKKLPLDEAGFNAIGSWGCTYGPYTITKFLMIQLAKQVSQQEAAFGNDVYAFSFAPGPINTGLLPGTFACCFEVDGYLGDGCRFQLPYVGPRDADGNPDPPVYDVGGVPNFWTSPQHGTMAPIYAALQADPADAGSFLGTYWECEMERGYFPMGITEQGRAQIYNSSFAWAGLDDADFSGRDETGGDVGELGPTSAAAWIRGNVALAGFSAVTTLLLI